MRDYKMNDKMNDKYAKRDALSAALKAKVMEAFTNPVTGILIDPIIEWSTSFDQHDRLTSVEFGASRDVRFDEILRLSKVLGTEAINFNFGEDGSPGYSEETPGTEGSRGWVQVLFENGWTP